MKNDNYNINRDEETIDDFHCEFSFFFNFKDRLKWLLINQIHFDINDQQIGNLLGRKEFLLIEKKHSHFYFELYMDVTI